MVLQPIRLRCFSKYSRRLCSFSLCQQELGRQSESNPALGGNRSVFRAFSWSKAVSHRFSSEVKSGSALQDFCLQSKDLLEDFRLKVINDLFHNYNFTYYFESFQSRKKINNLFFLLYVVSSYIIALLSGWFWLAGETQAWP